MFNTKRHSNCSAALKNLIGPDTHTHLKLLLPLLSILLVLKISW